MTDKSQEETDLKMFQELADNATRVAANPNNEEEIDAMVEAVDYHLLMLEACYAAVPPQEE